LPNRFMLNCLRTESDAALGKRHHIHRNKDDVSEM
jgi:hypothetical protein